MYLFYIYMYMLIHFFQRLTKNITFKMVRKITKKNNLKRKTMYIFNIYIYIYIY